VTHLALLSAFVAVPSFEDEGLPVNRVPGLHDSHGDQLKTLWAEVMMVRERYAAYEEPALTISPMSKIDN
jgi:hypothetical protein